MNKAAIKVQVREKYETLFDTLNERSRRIWAATAARAIGRGGQIRVSEATGSHKNTVLAGMKEIRKQKDTADIGNIRRTGGGRNKNTAKDGSLIEDIQKLVEASTRGNPESTLLWSSKSTRNIADELNKYKKRVSHMTVAKELADMGYSLQSNQKKNEGGDHPDRDQQFRFINDKTKAFQQRNQPVISVDTKKKENLWNFKNNRREYHKQGEAPAVNVYDFLDQEKGKVAPYGVYDLDKNKGWASVGISSDTARFAVNSIRSWWKKMGTKAYPNVTEIYINADGGGSNG